MADADCIPAYDPKRFQFVRVCECGCNTPTQIIRHGSPQRGQIKWQPYRFATRHYKNPRRHRGYPEQGTGRDKQMLHRLRAIASRGGKPLPKGAVIHHPDEDPWNPNARLVICPNPAYHSLLHFRMRIQAAGGNPNTERICGGCRQVKLIEEFTNRRDYAGGRDLYCRACKKVLQAAAYRRQCARKRQLIDKAETETDTND
jgi:hypothetical protein